MKKTIVAPDDAKYSVFKAKAAKCSSFDQRVQLAKDLKQFATEIPKDKGFVIFRPNHFNETAEIIKDTTNITKSNKIKDWSNISKKNTRPDLLDKDSLTLESPYLRFALRQDVVATVSNYLGHVPVLNFIIVMCSRYYEDRLVGAQLFHCDYQDIHNVMIFMNTTDVLDSQDGPVTVIQRDKSRELRHRLLSKFGSKIQLNHAQELANVKDEWKHEMLGKAGTAAFVDSGNCFHFGSRVAKDRRDRMMVMFHYLSPAAINVDMSKDENRPFAKLNSEKLEEYQKYVLGQYI